MPHEAGVKSQTQPRLWGKGAEGMAAGTAHTSAPGPAFTPSHDLPSLVSPPFPGKALISYFSSLFPSTPYPLRLSPVLLSFQRGVNVGLFREALRSPVAHLPPQSLATASAQHTLCWGMDAGGDE